MSTQVEEKTAFDRLVEIDYSYLTRLWERVPQWNNCIFTESGKARLANIAGWLLGLAHGGKREEAEKLANDFVYTLSGLAMSDHKVEYETVGDRKITVPARKVVLHDDGTLHGFSFGMYSAIPPQAVEELREKVRAEHAGEDEWHQWRITSEVLTRLNVTEKVYGDELTEKRWYPDYGDFCVYYHYIFNGGLLYHGPGGGEVFAVTFGDSSRAWSTHT